MPKMCLHEIWGLSNYLTNVCRNTVTCNNFLNRPHSKLGQHCESLKFYSLCISQSFNHIQCTFKILIEGRESLQYPPCGGMEFTLNNANLVTQRS